MSDNTTSPSKKDIFESNWDKSDKQRKQAHATHKKWRSTESGKKKTRDQNERVRKTEIGKEKANARDAVRRAKEQGKLKTPKSCPKCRKTTASGDMIFDHNKSWSKAHALDGQFMCRTCHNKKDNLKPGEGGGHKKERIRGSRPKPAHTASEMTDLDRQVDRILSETDQGSDFPEQWRAGGPGDVKKFRSRRSGVKFRAPKIPKTDKKSLNFTLYPHPDHPNILIVPKTETEHNDFRVASTAFNYSKPYYVIRMSDGTVFSGLLKQGRIATGSTGPAVTHRPSDARIKLLDLTTYRIQTIPTKQIATKIVGGVQVPDVTTIDEDSPDYWDLHKKYIKFKLKSDGSGSQYQPGLVPKEDESLDDYSYRIRQVTPQPNMFLYYHPVELNPTTGKYKWLPQVDGEYQISKIAALIPKNLGSPTIDALGNVKQSQVPDFLLDQETGFSNIESAGKGGIIKPQQGAPKEVGHAQRAKKPREPNWLTINDLEAQTQAVKNPFSDEAMHMAFKELAPEEQKKIKQEAKNELIASVATQLSGGKQKWFDATNKQRNKWLEQAETQINQNIKEFKDSYKKIIFDKVRDGRLLRLGLKELTKLKRCPSCKGVGKVKELTYDDKLNKEVYKKNTCTACRGTGKSPLGAIDSMGFLPRVPAKEMDHFTNATQKLISNLFQSGPGIDMEDKIKSEWVPLAQKLLGKDFLEESEALFFFNKLFKAIKKHEVNIPKDRDKFGNTYGTVYTQTTLDKSLIDRSAGFKQIADRLQKGYDITWGFGVDKIGPGGLPMGEKRLVNIKHLYNQYQRNPKRARFIEIRRFHTAEKHLNNELMQLTKVDPRIRKMIESQLQGGIKTQAVEKALQKYKGMLGDAVREHDPQPNTVIGIGLITNIRKEMKGGLTKRPYEAGAEEYAKSIGKDFSNMSDKAKKELQVQVLAMRLAAQDEGISQDSPMNELKRYWNSVGERDKTSYKLRAKRGEELAGRGGEEFQTGEKLIGRKEESTPVTYVLDYLNIETGSEDRMVFKSADGIVFLTRPIVQLMAIAHNKAQREGLGKPDVPGAGVDESLMRLPRNMLKSIDPKMLANFVD